jgi:hypothetical protein
MVLRDPGDVEAELVGGDEHFEGLGVDLRLWLVAFEVGEEPKPKSTVVTHRKELLFAAEDVPPPMQSPI